MILAIGASKIAKMLKIRLIIGRNGLYNFEAPFMGLRAGLLIFATRVVGANFRILGPLAAALFADNLFTFPKLKTYCQK